MADTLLWSLEETARQLGGVSTKTIRRMINNGELSSVKVRRSIRIVAESVNDWLDRSITPRHTLNRVEPGERRPIGGKRSWHTNAKTARTGGSLSQIQAEKELNALLEQRIERKRKH